MDSCFAGSATACSGFGEGKKTSKNPDNMEPLDNGRTPPEVLAFALRYLGASCLSSAILNTLINSIAAARAADAKTLANRGLRTEELNSSKYEYQARVIIS